MENLPNLRFIAKPSFGFGFDARLRFGFGCNCFMAAESYINGQSFIGFGLEPRKASWIRFQFAPTAKVILRLPIIRISEFKYGYAGTELTLFDKGSYPKPNTSSTNAFWKSVQKFIRPALEVQHHNTILGTLLDERQRKILKDAFREISARRKLDVERLQANRDRVMKTFDPPELPSLDPRRGASELRMRIHELNKQRKLRIPGQSPLLLDELQDKNLFKNDGNEDDRPNDSLGSNSQRTRNSPGIVLAVYNAHARQSEA